MKEISVNVSLPLLDPLFVLDATVTSLIRCRLVLSCRPKIRNFLATTMACVAEKIIDVDFGLKPRTERKKREKEAFATKPYNWMTFLF